MTPEISTLVQGTVPLLVSIPHGGEYLPETFAARMTPAARLVADTDWHLARLYDFALKMGGSMLRANYSRYVIDLNRPSNGESLYPGQTTTGLCPAETFRGEPIYAEGFAPPDAAETARRVADYWLPYHQALQAEIDRLKAAHGQVLVWEAHSIASVLPRLFPGELPGLNVGTFDGRSCAPQMREAVVAATSASPFTWAADARFKGGFITRHYGRPQEGVHTVQLEMCQSLYMDETAPFAWREDRASRVQPTVEAMVRAAFGALGKA
ncbi:N-formylglutamate deformylase [Xylophilus rhododendri]|uniref:N-formylglutamate deformylase n=1 Tax=Xylophilus rhododendri TaxID=2697032 RepID=A0A857J9N3_9BURK|nr:N-formylglutamate deformylase [Xylophilus rhododendri]QHI99465.1 N-formylglutamate deformylase [Xylophilus rhododendri]